MHEGRRRPEIARRTARGRPGPLATGRARPVDPGQGRERTGLVPATRDEALDTSNVWLVALRARQWPPIDAYW